MKQFKRITLIAVLLITAVIHSQTQTFNSQVRIKQVPLSSLLDSLVTINSSGLLTYLPKSELTTEAQTLSFSAGQLTISDANTVDLDTYYYSQSDVNATFLPLTGGFLTGGLTAMDYITTYNGTGLSYISSDRDAGSSRFRVQMNTSSGLAFFTLYNVTTATTLSQLKMSFEDIKYNDNLIYHAGNLDLSNYIEKAAFYEEGTFTPTLTDAGGGSTYTFTAPGAANANYVRTGNRITGNLTLTNINTTGTPTGVVKINGLPNQANMVGFSAFNVANLNGGDVAYYSVYGLCASTGLEFRIQATKDTDINQPLSSNTFTSGEFIISFEYTVNVYTP